MQRQNTTFSEQAFSTVSLRSVYRVTGLLGRRMEFIDKSERKRNVTYGKLRARQERLILIGRTPKHYTVRVYYTIRRV